MHLVDIVDHMTKQILNYFLLTYTMKACMLIRFCLFFAIFYLLSKYFPGIDNYIFLSVLGITGLKYLYQFYYAAPGTSKEQQKTENT